MPTLYVVDIDGSGAIHITGSSNRVIKVEELRYVIYFVLICWPSIVLITINLL